MTLDNDFDLHDYMNLGNILVRRGTLTRKQVEKAAARQKEHGGRLGEQLVAMGFCTADDVSYALRVQEQQRDLPESRSDAALLSLEAAVGSLEQSARRLTRVGKQRGVEVIGISADESGAFPISRVS